MGRLKYEGLIYDFVDFDENGYEILCGRFGSKETKWIDRRSCLLEIQWTKEEPKEPSYLTPKNEFEKALINTCTDLAQTLIKKNRDYGDSFRLLYDEYGDFSTEHRLTDKLNRFKTLNKQDNLVKDEGKDDTLLDIAGYSILTLATKKLTRVGE